MADAPIVVGIEDTTAAGAALRWAASESQKTRTPLVVVHAYAPDELDAASPELLTVGESVARSWATQWVRDALSEGAALPWRTHLVVTPETPGPALVRVSRDAGLVVLGSSGDPRTSGEKRGSVRSDCETGADCPVVLVPSPPLEGSDEPSYRPPGRPRHDPVPA